MSNTAILLVGTLVFAVTVWATLAVGYARFGHWYDRDRAAEHRRRRRLNREADARGRPHPARAADEISHDAPDRLEELSGTGPQQGADPAPGARPGPTTGEEHCCA